MGPMFLLEVVSAHSHQKGKPPRSTRDLTLCRMFRRNTCCDVSHTHSAFLSIRKLAPTGEANQECLHLWEVLECSLWDPDVGVKPGPLLISASFCDKLFQACSDAYFSMDGITQTMTDSQCMILIHIVCFKILLEFPDQTLCPRFVCGRASEWISNGTELCRAVAVQRFRPYQLGNILLWWEIKYRLHCRVMEQALNQQLPERWALWIPRRFPAVGDKNAIC